MTINLTTSPRQVARISESHYRNVYVQLLSGSSANISIDDQALLDNGGLNLLATDRIVRLVWRGPIWVSGSGVLSIEIV